MHCEKFKYLPNLIKKVETLVVRNRINLILYVNTTNKSQSYFHMIFI